MYWEFLKIRKHIHTRLKVWMTSKGLDRACLTITITQVVLVNRLLLIRMSELLLIVVENLSKFRFTLNNITYDRLNVVILPMFALMMVIERQQRINYNIF